MKGIDVWDAILLLLTFRKHHPSWLYDRWDASERQFPEPDEYMVIIEGPFVR
ncbi:hypothetical protein FOYG_09269 [Fusarium oxysporum NRRL 32931]|uniref:Uncharacterized protein n=1 Tax=Fusarium oxysporum NRRL 32931 TaxID=660029 RepID=W9HZY9_FUSOX|nr:hypothetical protein FOYG_09269 [Fusarium oxysporum NRRL 32931]